MSCEISTLNMSCAPFPRCPSTTPQMFRVFWEDATEEEKLPYEQEATADRERYEREKASFLEKGEY